MSFTLSCRTANRPRSFQSLPTVYEAMLQAKISRSDLVIALGGGVIGDLAGFAASSFLRGDQDSYRSQPRFWPRSIPRSAEKLQWIFRRAKIWSAHSIIRALVLIDLLKYLNTLPKRLYQRRNGRSVSNTAASKTPRFFTR